MGKNVLVDELVRSMRSRMPWNVARQIFRLNALHRSQGWDRTVTKVKEGDLDYASKKSELLEALEEHLLCGEKMVRLYRLDDGDIQDLRTAISSLEAEETPFRAHYPILIDDEKLEGAKGLRPTIAAIRSFSEGTAVAFASSRYLTTREVMLPTEFSESTAAELNTYNEVIGVRYRRHEAIDVLWVPNNSNVVELRIDYPFGAPVRDGTTAIANAEEQVRRRLGKDYLPSSANLYPAIQSLYDDQNDGRMVELGFMVGSASQKLEKSRRDSGCCRVEAYHVGGKSALADPIQPYRTAVMWAVDFGDGVISYPEVVLRGTTLNTTEGDPRLTEMIVRNCAGFKDYDHLRDRIIAHIS